MNAAEFLRSHGWTHTPAGRWWRHPRVPAPVKLVLMDALLQQAIWLERDLHDAKNALARLKGLEGET